MGQRVLQSPLRPFPSTFVIQRVLSWIVIWSMASHSTSFPSSGYSYKIPEQFINPAKLPTRLDQLLGAKTYTCRWKLNHYHIRDAPRRLDEVSKPCVIR